MNIESMSNAQIEQVLEKRRSRQRTKPSPLENPDFTRVKQLCSAEIDTRAAGGRVKDDADHYIYEAAMEAVFGKDVWAWINSNSE